MVDSAFPAYAYDDDLIHAARRDGQARVRVFRLTDTVVVLGSGSRPDVELHLDACHADRVPILRRRGGGCSVVLDPGNVIVSAVVTGLPFGHHRRHFDMLTSWLIAGLERIGVSGVSQAGICDLALDDRKVGGACLHRARDLLYYSASLLIDPDMDKVTRYLKHPPREPSYRQERCHASFMGSLRPALGADDALDRVHHVDVKHVATHLRRALQPPVAVSSPRIKRGTTIAAMTIRAATANAAPRDNTVLDDIAQGFPCLAERLYFCLNGHTVWTRRSARLYPDRIRTGQPSGKP